MTPSPPPPSPPSARPAPEPEPAPEGTGHGVRTVGDLEVCLETMDVHIQRLRAKVGSGRIVTVRGFGYKIVG